MTSRLRPKYMVFKTDEKTGAVIPDGAMPSTDPEDIDSPFVLMPRKDPAAFAALSAYATVCEPELAREIRMFLHMVTEASPAFGTQGTRNFQHMQRNIISGDK